ncbi:hypothetical protein AGMMS49975_14440 [Clostridia bacterium]|nr:hypothetical protein AGMMS49975_14440 [Clostridia bacterium]
MKLVMAIVNDEDAFRINDALTENGFPVTKLASTGGLLRAGNTTFISGIADERVPELIGIIERHCKSRKQITSVPSSHIGADVVPYPIEVTVGGGTIFVLNVDDFKKV